MALNLENIDLQKELDLAEKAEKAAAATPPETPPETPPVTAPETPPAPVVELVEAEPAKTPVTKVVPLAALHEARDEIKGLKEELKSTSAENVARIAALQQRLDLLQNPPPEKPDFTTDPAGHLKSELDEIKQRQLQTENQNLMARMENEIQGRLVASETAFTKEHPDYADAANHVAAVINKNLDGYGVTDPAKHALAFKQEVQRITVAALQAGKEPAELIYTMAKNFGFTGAPKKDSATKLETVAKGQEASKTLGPGSRSESSGLTIDALSKMDDDEFSSLVADDKKWREIGKLFH